MIVDPNFNLTMTLTLGGMDREPLVRHIRHAKLLSWVNEANKQRQQEEEVQNGVKHSVATSGQVATAATRWLSQHRSLAQVAQAATAAPRKAAMQLQAKLFEAAEAGSVLQVRKALAQGAVADFVHPKVRLETHGAHHTMQTHPPPHRTLVICQTGTTALHVAARWGGGDVVVELLRATGGNYEWVQARSLPVSVEATRLVCSPTCCTHPPFHPPGSRYSAALGCP